MMQRAITFALAFLLSFAVAAQPASGAEGKVATLVLPVEFQSQLTEASPTGWAQYPTPYCVAASSTMVLKSFGVVLPNPSLEELFFLGRKGNTTNDPGIDPDGASYLMRYFGGDGAIHAYPDQATALNELIGRLNYGSPVVVFAQAGNHAIVAYGYEADWGGTVTAIYAADPLSGFNGRVPVDAWTTWYMWFGAGFSAPGDKWQGQFVFVSYRDFR